MYRFILLATLCLQASIAFARPNSIETMRIPFSGKSKLIRVESNQTSEVVFWGITRGSSSTPFSLRASGPAGIRVNVFTQQIRGRRTKSSLKRLVRARKGATRLSIRTQADRLTAQAQCVSIAPGETGEEDPKESDFPSDPTLIEGLKPSGLTCEDFSEGEVLALQERLIQIFPPSWTREQVCEYIASPFYTLFGDLTESLPMALVRARSTLGEWIDVTGTLHKDACLPSQTEYLVQVVVDLSQIDVAAYPNGFDLSIGMKEYPYDGAKASTIKPVSDGKFAPQPLALMSYLGFCGQELSVVRWSGGRVSSTSPIRIEDLITYAGNLYTRSVIGSELTGGPATFEIMNGFRGYGVCFALDRRRQRVEGYR